MARYTGPTTRISRRFGVHLLGSAKALERRNYPPGQHGPKSRRKVSEYSVGLGEKQKLRYVYGLLERQFRRYFEAASPGFVPLAISSPFFLPSPSLSRSLIFS